MTILYLIVIGAVVGWIAGKLMKGGGYGLLGNIILGIAGAIVGGMISNWLNISLGSGLIAQILTGVGGAVILLAIIGFIKKK